MTAIKIIEADLENPLHAEAVLHCLDQYARDPFGNGKPLDEEIKSRLIPGLKAHPAHCIHLAYQGSSPVGIAVSFFGFSTFKAKPLLNIHDLSVESGHRGRGIGKMLLNAVFSTALERGCCKVTLEVQEENSTAYDLYRKCGFKGMTFSYGERKILFLEKPL